MRRLRADARRLDMRHAVRLEAIYGGLVALVAPERDQR
jgi:hypothetical protein